MPHYQAGFAHEFASEALPGALPSLQNSPQRCPYGLYAEQWSGTAFTVPRHDSRRSWLYRIRPSAIHGEFERMPHPGLAQTFDASTATPNRLRWSPLPIPDAEPTDFVQGLFTVGGNPHTGTGRGCAVHWYVANRSMTNRFFYDADAELLLVPQTGRLRLATELGVLCVEPLEIALIPRGLRFRVELLEPSARGYVCENFGAPLRLPDLGPIGSNGLARAQDFQAPVAAYEDLDGDFELLAKFGGTLWRAALRHSPLDVVAWRGTNAPCKYDLRRFNTIGSISYDHPDPSIFLVLQSLGDQAGADELDFVIFPPRWLAMTDTFRPPWFHRNVASEFMGLIEGRYDAKDDGFVPGGASLHNCMSGHGPDAPSYEKGVRADTRHPEFVANTMAFMFESRLPIHPTAAALGLPQRQADYGSCWESLPKRFSPQSR